MSDKTAPQAGGKHHFPDFLVIAGRMDEKAVAQGGGAVKFVELFNAGFADVFHYSRALFFR